VLARIKIPQRCGTFELEPLVVPEHSLVLAKVKVTQRCGTFDLEPLVVTTARPPSSLAKVKVPQRCGTFEFEPLVFPEHSLVLAQVQVPQRWLLQ
jgi:hypothetical protein